MKLPRMLRRVATSLLNCVFTWMEWEENQVRKRKMRRWMRGE